MGRSRSGYRFFLAYADGADLKAGGYLREPPADLSPLVSPWWSESWPAGWVEAICNEGCDVVPGPRCGCGMTFMEKPEQLAWYRLVQTRRAFVDNPRAVRRLAFTRVEVRGRVVSQDRRGHPSFEHRAAACRTAEIWLPRAGQRFAGQIQDHYGVPVHVSDLDGEAWLRDMCPDIPNIPAPAPPETLPEDSERVLREGIALMRGLPQTPQVRASIARGEPTLRLLERRPQASFQVELRGIPAGERDDMLVDLAAALPAEFPAFRVTTWRHHGDWAEVFVAGVDGTPRHALSRLDGWGHDRLVLRRAVVTPGSGRRQAGTRLWGGTLPGERRALRPSVRPNGSHSTW